MDKATIEAAIVKAEEQQERVFLLLKNKGEAIGRNRATIKDKQSQINTLQMEIEGLTAKGDMLKIDLTELKVKEGNIIGTKEAFKTMLDAAK